MRVITEKPNVLRIRSEKEAPVVKQKEEDKDDVDKELDERLGEASAVPKKKYRFPMTAAQEIGWDLEEFKQPEGVNTKVTNKKKGCFETSYANSYVTMTGKSPYAVEKGDKGQ